MARVRCSELGSETGHFYFATWDHWRAESIVVTDGSIAFLNLLESMSRGGRNVSNTEQLAKELVETVVS